MRLASHLRCRPSVIERTWSARDFIEFSVWMEAEQIGPDWDRLRHAELAAAAANGGRAQHVEGRPFKASDFMAADPWAKPVAEMSPAALKQSLAADLAHLEDEMFG